VGIHALDAVFVSAEKAWITGSSSVMATMGTGSRLGKKSPHRLAILRDAPFGAPQDEGMPLMAGKRVPHPEEAAQAAVSKDALRRSSRLGILAQPDRSAVQPEPVNRTAVRLDPQLSG
jgi:hypothetical protein